MDRAEREACDCTNPWAHDQCTEAKGCKIKKKLLRTLPQRKPLTDEEINDRARAEGAHNADFWLGVRFAEAAHNIKEKNTRGQE